VVDGEFANIAATWVVDGEFANICSDLGLPLCVGGTSLASLGSALDCLSNLWNSFWSLGIGILWSASCCHGEASWIPKIDVIFRTNGPQVKRQHTKSSLVLAPKLLKFELKLRI
jgi:hypothetical protein